jgi:hypothetical protein
MKNAVIKKDEDVLLIKSVMTVFNLAFGTPFVNATVVAKVCRAQWKVSSLVMPQRSASSIRYCQSFGYS